jgi:hypothetical protein
MVDEHAPHHRRRDRKELLAVLPVFRPLRMHSQIRLMHERGWFEDVVRTFSPQPRRGPAAKLCIHRSQQAITRVESAGAPGAQQTSDIARRTAPSVVRHGLWVTHAILPGPRARVKLTITADATR